MTDNHWEVQRDSADSALVRWNHCSEQPLLYCILYYYPGGKSTIDITDGSSTSHELRNLGADTYIVVLICQDHTGNNTVYDPALLTRSEYDNW